MHSKSDLQAAAWLELAYGSAEASRIMGLPTELRESLYGDVLTYGPAGEQIAKVIKAVPHRPMSDTIELWDSIVRLGNAFPYEDEQEPFTEWAFLVQPELDAAIAKASRSGSLDFTNGFQLLLWALNGQHLFPPHVVSFVSAAGLIDDVNKVLAILEWLPLSGRLIREEVGA